MPPTTPNYHTAAPVLVTGATGYVAGWIVKNLLEKGFTVHAAVRDPANIEKIGYLKALTTDDQKQLKFFKTNLLEDGSYDEAMEGCEVVFHTASPFTSEITNPQTDLVDPAVKGTENVLSSANRIKSVRRVVVTSSCAAIYSDNIDLQKLPGQILNEEIWNTGSSLQHQPYFYSKVEAEKVAWDMARSQNRWTLVTINPSLVLGPGVGNIHSSESFSIIRQFGDGTLKMGVPSIEIGVVDVRDVAEAHLRAGFIKDAEGRHIISAKTVSFLELGDILKQKAGNDWPFPSRIIPKWLIWLIGPMLNKNMTRKMVSRTINYPWKADHSKSVIKLGMSYRPIDQTIAEMFEQMIDNGIFLK